MLEGIDVVLRQAALIARRCRGLHPRHDARHQCADRAQGRAGPRCITTEGFRDILEQGYEKRFDHYDLMIDRPAPLVPRTRRFTVRERLAADGDVLIPLDEAAVAAIGAASSQATRWSAVAIGFLHAYAHDDHERRVRELLHAPAR